VSGVSGVHTFSKTPINLKFVGKVENHNTLDTPDTVKEEFIYDSQELIHLQCSICGETPCVMFAENGKPLCEDCKNGTK